MASQDKLERDFQRDVKAELERRLPGCFIIKGNSAVRQGIPDWLILYKDRWAMLEVKRSATSRFRPNQEYYISLLGEMSFAAVIHQQNFDEVLDAIQSTLGSKG